MRKPNILRKAALALAVTLTGIFVSASAASAIQYDGSNTQASPVPAFNVFTGVPTVGNESDFLRSRVPTAASGDTTTPYVDPLSASCAPGQRIQMRVYVHNGASVDGNQNGSGPSVAHGTKVKVNLPGNEASSFTPSATISSTNAGTVNDNATINCNGRTVKLRYISGSASQYSIGTGAIALSDDIVTNGVPIRSQSVEGDVWGCWNDRVYVILSVQVEEIPVTPPPVTATCDIFRITASDDRKVKVSQFKYSTSNNNAVFRSVLIDWGDSQTASDQLTLTDASKVIGQEHQYKADGTYNITAVVTFGITGENARTSGGAGTNCAQQVTFSTTQPPKVTPPPTTVVTTTPPAQLVNTGPGSVVAIFAAVTAAGMFAYRKMLTRRLGEV